MEEERIGVKIGMGFGSYIQ